LSIIFRRAQVNPEGSGTSGKASYKLTSSILLSMGVAKESVGDTNLSGTMTKQAIKSLAYDAAAKPHLANVGSMIEDMEIDLR